MQKVELEIVALSPSITQSQSYAVVLGEIDGLRRIPIVIGGYEAQAIAVALEKIKPSRPLTHDLMRNMFDAFDLELHEVLINDFSEGIFYAKLICSNHKETVEIDSRTSDALALAVRLGAPIYTFEHIIDSAGIVLEGQTKEIAEPARPKTSKPTNDLSDKTIEELQEMLNEVLENEDYIKAAAIRDEIKSRK
jgi:uncharacterized protein